MVVVVAVTIVLSLPEQFMVQLVELEEMWEQPIF